MYETERMRSVKLNNIRINDSFWSKHTNLVKDVILPYQWDAINDRIEGAEPSHCLNNFKIAAGLVEGKHGGAVFQDTDVAKWLEAVAYTLATEKDDALENIADEVIDLIGKAQCQDGYINTYFTIKAPKKRWKNLSEGHELYTAGHLIEAAVAYYEATGKNKFLNIVMKFADLICDVFGEGKDQIHGYPGHQEIELAMIKLYYVSGVRKYLDIAKFFIDTRGVSDNYFIEERKKKDYELIFPELKDYLPIYSQSHLPVREQKTAEGHAVRATYMYCAMIDLAFEYKDKSLLESCETLWNNMVNKRMFITGSIGSSGLLERFTTDYDLPNDRNYSETCASIGLGLFGLRMAQITGKSHYIDIVERALYNTVLSGIALDGQSFFYVNPLEVWPNNCIDRTSMEHVKSVRQKWFGVACCPPNIARTLASLGQYIYSVRGNQLYLNLFISNQAKVELKEEEVNVEVITSFPKDNSFVLKVYNCKNEIEIGLRVPEYATNYSIFVNNRKTDTNIINGFAILKGNFSNTEISVTFDAEARFIHANPEVREDAGKVCIMKGPIVYALEEIDNGKNLASIFIDTNKPLETVWEPSLFNGVTSILADGKIISNKGWKGELYKEQRTTFENIRIKAVPYAYWGNRKPGEMIVWIKELIS